MGGEPQVYKVVAPCELSEHEIDKWFARCDGSPVHVAHYKCAQYSAPQSFHPFVFDAAGVYYIDAAAHLNSTKEMSLIGARNVVNLIRNWIEQRRGPCGF